MNRNKDFNNLEHLSTGNFKLTDQNQHHIPHPDKKSHKIFLNKHFSRAHLLVLTRDFSSWWLEGKIHLDTNAEKFESYETELLSLDTSKTLE